MHMSELHAAIEHHGIVRCPPGFVLKGIPEGKIYSWQFYLRRMLFNQDTLKVITRSFLDLVAKDITSHQFAGMESAGPPIISAMLQDSPQYMRAFAIRKEQKKYGLLNWIEGDYTCNSPVVLIDDISNSKNTLMRAKEICNAVGMSVDYAVTLVNKKTTDVDEKSNLQVKSLFTIDDFALTWDEYYTKYPDTNVSYLARDFVVKNQHSLWAVMTPKEVISVSQVFEAAGKGIKFNDKVNEAFAKCGIIL